MKIDLDFGISKNIWQLLDLLKDHNAAPRFVGGIVRDALRAFVSGTSFDKGTDIDIATKLKPSDLIEIFKQNHIKYVDIGSQFGTVIAVIEGHNIEITTLRLDFNCDGRHAEVHFTDDFELDAKRRDFTINAMSYCPYKKELYDYFGGLGDLKLGIVKFIGDPLERIDEDHLRILRFFRFTDRYAAELHEESYKACLAKLDLVEDLSAERKLAELAKMIQSNTASEIYQMMHKARLLVKIFGDLEFDFKLLSEIDLNITNIRFAALLSKIEPKTLSDILRNLKFSNKDTKQIQDLVSFRNKHGDMRECSVEFMKPIFMMLWIDNYDVTLYARISLAYKNKTFKEIERIYEYQTKPAFPVDGNDILDLGLKGARISETLYMLKKAWVESDFSLTKADLLKK